MVTPHEPFRDHPAAGIAGIPPVGNRDRLDFLLDYFIFIEVGIVGPIPPKCHCIAPGTIRCDEKGRIVGFYGAEPCHSLPDGVFQLQWPHSAANWGSTSLGFGAKPEESVERQAAQADNDAQVIAMWLHGRSDQTQQAYARASRVCNVKNNFKLKYYPPKHPLYRGEAWDGSMGKRLPNLKTPFGNIIRGVDNQYGRRSEAGSWTFPFAGLAIASCENRAAGIVHEWRFACSCRLFINSLVAVPRSFGLRERM